MKYVPTPTKLKHFKNVLRLKSSKSVIKNIQPRPQIILSYKKRVYRKETDQSKGLT